MERGEKVGLGAAIVGHAALIALLSLGLVHARKSEPVKPQPTIDVSLVKDVGLEAAAPQSAEAPAPSVAPDQGLPEDAAPPEAPPPEPTPQKPEPQSEPKPQPKPAPPKPAPEPASPKAKPVARPESKPQPKAKPQPQPKREAKAAPKAKPAPAKPAPTTSKNAPAPKSTASTSKTATKENAAKGSGSNAEAKAARPRGSRLGANFLKGLSDKPSTGKSETPRAAKIDARALAGIRDAIARQIQPCADRQIDPGPGANQIVTVLNLRLNQDGTLSATPRVVRQTGVTDENDRYARRVIDLGIAAFKGCSPLKLPAEYYSTPGGGWNNINYNWQLR